MPSELTVIVDAAHAAGRASGSAARFGFVLHWDAAWDGTEWIVEVPRGHALGPDGKGAFEVVTADNWPAFAAAVRRAVQTSREKRPPPKHPPGGSHRMSTRPVNEEQSS